MAIHPIAHHARGKILGNTKVIRLHPRGFMNIYPDLCAI